VRHLRLVALLDGAELEGIENIGVAIDAARLGFGPIATGSIRFPRTGCD
jgi:hypothetical protein